MSDRPTVRICFLSVIYINRHGRSDCNIEFRFIHKYNYEQFGIINLYVHREPHNSVEKEKQKPWYKLVFELLTNTWLAGIMGLLSRKLLQYLSKQILGLNFRYTDYLKDDILTSTGFFMTYLMTLNGKYKTQVSALSEEWSSAKIAPKMNKTYENIISHLDLYNMFSK